MNNLRKVLIVSSLWLLGGAAALGQEPEVSSMFRSDPQHTGVYRTSGPLTLCRVKWKFEAGRELAATPAISGGVVYVGAYGGEFYSLDARTGKEARPSVMDPGRYHFIASPVITDGAVYFLSLNGYLYSRNASTGANRWPDTGEKKLGRVLLGEESQDKGVVSSPAFADGVVYFGSEDSYLYAVDAATGRQKWQFLTRDPVMSSPTVIDGMVYFGGVDRQLYAIDVNTQQEKWRFQTPERIIASPAVHRGQGLVYIPSEDGVLYAIDMKTGKERWKSPARACAFCAPAIAGGMIYIGGGNILTALDAASGQQMWKYVTLSPGSSSPAVADGVGYFGTVGGTLYALE